MWSRVHKPDIKLLFISYRFVKHVLAITFLLLVIFLSETDVICVNVFYIVRNEISAGSDKRQRISPSTPIVRIALFGNVMSIDMTLPKWTIFTMCIYGLNFHFFVGSSWNFVSDCIKKRWHTSWKFQLEIRSNKKVIAKKRFTNLYEINSCLNQTQIAVLTLIMQFLLPGVHTARIYLNYCSRRYVLVWRP